MCDGAGMASTGGALRAAQVVAGRGSRRGLGVEGVGDTARGRPQHPQDHRRATLPIHGIHSGIRICGQRSHRVGEGARRPQAPRMRAGRSPYPSIMRACTNPLGSAARSSAACTCTAWEYGTSARQIGSEPAGAQAVSRGSENAGHCHRDPPARVMPLDKVIDGMKAHLANVKIHHERGDQAKRLREVTSFQDQLRTTWERAIEDVSGR